MKGRRFGITAVSVAVGIGATVVIGHMAGLRLNFTDSAPLGLWRVQPVKVVAIKRGDLIEVCPPSSPVVMRMSERHYLSPGNCSGSGVIPLLKPVSAVAGDMIRLKQGQPVSVNGVELPNTITMPAIPAWPDGDYTVKATEIWLFSSYSAGSFDSRYFGPVELASVRGIASSVLVHGDMSAITKGLTKP